jgi:acyl-CoA reductase-like NAD-dependent aldehyde dehydrogenase
MTVFAMTIDGASVTTDTTLQVLDPATGEVFAQVPDCTREQLDDAMEAARAAFVAAPGMAERRAMLHECADAVDAVAEELGYIQTREQGMPVAASIARVKGAANGFRRYAALDIPVVAIKDDETARIQVTRRPLGVIVVITAWNGPLLQAMNNIAPALWTGNSVVVKPSPFTPAATLRLGEVLGRVVPPGLVNVVSGADPLGQWAVEHPVPRGVSFTGSVETGRKVNVAAAADLKRVLLELGGNDPAIVLDDVDPVVVARRLFTIAFRNSGQVCQAPKRIFVPEHMHDEIATEMARCAREAKVGSGLDEGTRLGPVANEVQFEKVKDLVRDAVTAGGELTAGGSVVDRPGYFFEPTIVTGVKEGTRIVDEEQFGPVLPLMAYRDVDEAVRRANATHYGLGASVGSADEERAQQVADQLETGNVWINTHAEQHPDAPFGGVKLSGLGRRNGAWSLQSFTEVETVWVSHDSPVA